MGIEGLQGTAPAEHTAPVSPEPGIHVSRDPTSIVSGADAKRPAVLPPHAVPRSSGPLDDCFAGSAEEVHVRFVEFARSDAPATIAETGQRMKELLLTCARRHASIISADFAPPQRSRLAAWLSWGIPRPDAGLTSAMSRLQQRSALSVLSKTFTVLMQEYMARAPSNPDTRIAYLLKMLCGVQKEFGSGTLHRMVHAFCLDVPQTSSLYAHEKERIVGLAMISVERDEAIIVGGSGPATKILERESLASALKDLALAYADFLVDQHGQPQRKRPDPSLFSRPQAEVLAEIKCFLDQDVQWIRSHIQTGRCFIYHPYRNGVPEWLWDGMRARAADIKRNAGSPAIDELLNNYLNENVWENQSAMDFMSSGYGYDKFDESKAWSADLEQFRRIRSPGPARGS